MLLGETRVSRPNLGNRLTKRSPTVYTDAGVKDFKKYMDLAVAHGVVNIGGGGYGQWVELRASSHGAGNVPSAN